MTGADFQLRWLIIKTSGNCHFIFIQKLQHPLRELGEILCTCARTNGGAPKLSSKFLGFYIGPAVYALCHLSVSVSLPYQLSFRLYYQRFSGVEKQYSVGLYWEYNNFKRWNLDESLFQKDGTYTKPVRADLSIVTTLQPTLQTTLLWQSFLVQVEIILEYL